VASGRTKADASTGDPGPQGREGADADRNIPGVLLAPAGGSRHGQHAIVVSGLITVLLLPTGLPRGLGRAFPTDHGDADSRPTRARSQESAPLIGFILRQLPPLRHSTRPRWVILLRLQLEAGELDDAIGKAVLVADLLEVA
jgi:hypothetical protein